MAKGGLPGLDAGGEVGRGQRGDADALRQAEPATSAPCQPVRANTGVPIDTNPCQLCKLPRRPGEAPT